MGKILSGIALGVVLMPAMTFAATQNLAVAPPVVSANPQEASCDAQLDGFSKAFFQKQAQERGTFIAANQSLIAKQDARGRWMMLHKNDKTLANQAPPDLTSAEASVFSAFVAQQQAEKIAFFQRQVAAKQKCLGGQIIASTVGT